MRTQTGSLDQFAALGARPLPDQRESLRNSLRYWTARTDRDALLDRYTKHVNKSLASLASDRTDARTNWLGGPDDDRCDRLCLL